MQGGFSDRAIPAITSGLAKFLLILGFLFILFIFHLGSQPKVLSASESATITASNDINSILSNPINASHNLLLYAINTSDHSSILLFRLSSIVWGAVFLLSFYYLCRAWFGKSIALMGAVLLSSTPLFLISARQASTEIMFFSLLTIMACYVWLLRTESKDLAFFTLALVCALFAYTPGIVLWLLCSAFICRKKIVEAMEEVTRPAIVSAILLAILMMVPLGVAVARDINVIKSLVLLPASFPNPLDILKNIAWMFASLPAKTEQHSFLIVDRLPLLNYIQVALLIFGLYAMYSAARFKFFALFASIVLGVILAGVNNNIGLLALSLPAALIFITTGLRYLYIEWRSVFPHNPLAKALALSLMSGVVIVNLLFGLRYSLLAWPHAASASSTYVIK
jgi:4-amino-4-deoxy-L-arabinose transferase-like glycosyltransferase